MNKTNSYAKGTFYLSSRRRKKAAKAKQNNHPTPAPLKITDFDRRCGRVFRDCMPFNMQYREIPRDKHGRAL